jgi:hypothetical protein
MFWLKLILVPVMVGVVSAAGRRWGALVSGWLVGLPLSSGPVVLFLALEQGRAFAATSAKGTMTGLISVCVFSLTYSWLAIPLGWTGALLASWLTFLLATMALSYVTLTLAVSFFVVILALSLTLILLRKGEVGVAPPNPPVWEVLFRMFAATALVVTITELAHLIGPYVTGLLTPFPIFTTVFAVFTHRYQGPKAAMRLLRGVTTGLFTFACFFFLIAILITRAGTAAAFAAALSLAAILHAVSFWLLHRTSPQLRGTHTV